MIQNLIFWNSFLENIISGIQFFIFVHKFQWTSSEVSFNFRFSSRKSQSQQKLAKKITHFTIQSRSNYLTHFMNLNSLEIEKTCSCNRASNFSYFKNFLSTLFLLVLEITICTPSFLEV